MNLLQNTDLREKSRTIQNINILYHIQKCLEKF